MDRMFYAIPIWGIFIGTLLLALLCVDMGYRWAIRRQQGQLQEKEAPVGAIGGTTLGLLAFLLGFTFSHATEGFHARKIALVEEANAIRLTYQLSSLVAEAQRLEIRTTLRQYVDQRLRWSAGLRDEPGSSAPELLDRLWIAVSTAASQNPGNVDIFLTYASRVIELQQERLMVRERSRIPGALWVVLYLVAVLAFISVGYHGGVAGTVRSPAMVMVAIAFSAVIMIIADLDRPGQGFINVSPQPMIDLRAALAASRP